MEGERALGAHVADGGVNGCAEPEVVERPPVEGPDGAVVEDFAFHSSHNGGAKSSGVVRPRAYVLQPAAHGDRPQAHMRELAGDRSVTTVGLCLELGVWPRPRQSWCRDPRSRSGPEDAPAAVSSDALPVSTGLEAPRPTRCTFPKSIGQALWVRAPSLCPASGLFGPPPCFESVKAREKATDGTRQQRYDAGCVGGEARSRSAGWPTEAQAPGSRSSGIAGRCESTTGVLSRKHLLHALTLVKGEKTYLSGVRDRCFCVAADDGFGPVGVERTLRNS